ncbi:MAG: chorismate-binding protein, partial [Bacteroidia bacterium]
MEQIYLNNYSEFAAKAKLYASQFNLCAILDSCHIPPQCKKAKYKLVIGFGGNKVLCSPSSKLETLHETWNKDKTWILGVLGYNLKNEIEKLSSLNDTCFYWPDISFFAPETVITISWEDKLETYGLNSDIIFESINNFKVSSSLNNSINFQSDLETDFEKGQHGETVNVIKNEITIGNVYELNLCSRFLYKNISVSNPYALYEELIKISPAPFSAYFSDGNKYVLSASPERYLAKINNTLVSQPIKGTRPRGNRKEEDEILKKDLQTNIKDRAENVMIVDLVRNDMARVAEAGSVK